MAQLKVPKFGEMAIQCGFMSRESVDICLEVQTQEKRHDRVPRLGDLCVERGHISRFQLKTVLEMQEFTKVSLESRAFLKEFLEKNPGYRALAQAALQRQRYIFRDERKIMPVIEIMRADTRAWKAGGLRNFFSKVSGRVSSALN